MFTCVDRVAGYTVLSHKQLYNCLTFLSTKFAGIVCWIEAHLKSFPGRLRSSPTLCLSVMNRLSIILLFCACKPQVNRCYNAVHQVAARIICSEGGMM